MITTNVVLLEFLIRSRNLSDTGSAIAITSSTLPTTFLALSLIFICHPNYQKNIIATPAAVPSPQKIKSKRDPGPKSYHALSSSYLWYISLTNPVMALMIAAIHNEVVNENPMTRAAPTIRCRGWSMNSLLMVML